MATTAIPEPVTTARSMTVGSEASGDAGRSSNGATAETALRSARIASATSSGNERLRDRPSSFMVYASFVSSEFSNLANTVSPSATVDRGENLNRRVQDQLHAVRQKAEKAGRERLPEDYEAVFELDRLNLRLMNAEQIKLRAFALLERYRLMFSGEEFARITKVVHGIDTANCVSEQTIRAEADEVLASMHWYLLFSNARDKRLAGLINTSINALMFLAVLAISCTVTSLYNKGAGIGEITSFIVFLVIGGLGAATSFAWRLQSLLVAQPTLPETHLTDLSGLKYGRHGLFVSIGCGVVFAFVLYMAFAAGLVRGPLFPAINSPDDPALKGLELARFFSETGPAKGSEYAKLLVWLFVSGFAEKFVPDILDRIRTGSQAAKEPKH